MNEQSKTIIRKSIKIKDRQAKSCGLKSRVGSQKINENGFSPTILSSEITLKKQSNNYIPVAH
jgi:hypothetical protein